MGLTGAVDDGITTLRLDDGKVNALDAALVAELRAALRDVAGSRAVVITGRPGALTGGLNTRSLALMSSKEQREFFVDFGGLILDLWTLPTPVICAATGHAVAAGTLIALASDHVVAARGEFRWGMTEARIGLELADYAIMLVRARVHPAHADRLLLGGAVLSPDIAVAVGIADELADPVDVPDRALVAARELADLPREVFARNKARLRGDRAQAARASLRADVERFDLQPSAKAAARD